jgi:tRNA dimethylallyltransferase
LYPLNKIPVIVIFGPTAVGKTEFLLNFSKISEIINLDSLQVYKQMEIGTAAPEKEILDKIKHHLVGFLDPGEEFGTGDFVREADRLCREVYESGKIPLLSGGNAFFLRNFIYGLPESPESDLEIREMIQNRLEGEGASILRAELERVDPVSFKRIAENDHYRLTRALEVYHTTGRPLSFYSVPDKEREQYDFLLIGLIRERDELYKRINMRVDGMFETGLVDEYKNLRKMGYCEADPGMGGIGYSEFSLMERCGCFTLKDVKDMIKQDSRKYAKRQITFFKKIKNVIWENPENSSLILEKVNSFLSSYGKRL